MTRGAIFWVLMILTIVFGVWGHFSTGGNYFNGGLTLLELVLFGLLGWQVFGPAIT